MISCVLKSVQNLHCLGCISHTKQTRDPSWRKQSWIPRRTIAWWKASLPPQKESWAFFWTFSFHFLSFNGVFLSLKCRTLVLKLLHGDRAAAIVLKIDIFYRVSKYAKSGVFYAKIVQMTPPRLWRESLQLQKFSVRNTVLSLPFSRQIQFVLIVNVANLN